MRPRTLAHWESPRRIRGWFLAEQADGRGRIAWVMLVAVLLSAALSVHLFDIQVIRAGWLSEQAASQHEGAILIPAKRGEIFDSEGDVLASDVTVYDIYGDPAMIPQAERATVAAKLARILDLSRATLTTDLNEPTQFVYLSKGASQAVEDAVAALGISGLGELADQKRVYSPSPVDGQSFAEPELGFVNSSGQGEYGLEQYYNSLLTGVNGSQSTIIDDQGNPIKLSNTTSSPARNGDNLYLALNSQLQYWAEQAIAQGVNSTVSTSGEVIVLDTKTGGILAEAQYPSYNANAYATTPTADFLDASIAQLYEPGSVMKVVTFAGGLQNNAITPQYSFDEGPTTIDGITIHDWDHVAHGYITMQKVLDESLNDGAIKVEQLEGENNFYSNLLAFGIGEPTGVDLSGEENVALTAQSGWTPLDYAENSFGQEEEVSAMDMVAAINAVGNGGVWIQPHAVDSITDPNTGTTTEFAPTSRRVISTTTAQTLSKMMTGVVADPGAEGYMAQIPGWAGAIAAKTGTADEPTNGSYQGVLACSFTGFFPATDPQFTMLVVLQNPRETKVARFGSDLAAPVWKTLAEEMIDQWHLSPGAVYTGTSNWLRTTPAS